MHERQAGGVATVQLAHHHGTSTPEVHDARFQHIGAEIYKGAHRALAANCLSDRQLVEAILQRHDDAILGKMRCELSRGDFRVLRLDAQKRRVPNTCEFVGSKRWQRLRKSFNRTVMARPRSRIART